MITVLLLEDHVPVWQGLRQLLEARKDIKVVATAADGLERVTKARKLCPDVAVVDISVPLMDGMEAAVHIREFCPYTRILMLSIPDKREYVKRALQVGAGGYVLKEAIRKDLLAAIHAVYRGSHYFSDKIAVVAEAYLDQNAGDD
jgi:DNA-binding NarL/FixJ family response regulator